MKLQLVTGTPFQYTCIRCGKRFTAGDNQHLTPWAIATYADLEGKAFAAYYCAECVQKLPKLPVIVEQRYQDGDRVMIAGMPETVGTIIKVRFDSLDRPIYTIDLDDETQTPDGLFYARDSELILISRRK